MFQVGAWPKSMEYLNCNDYDGTNTPDRAVDLRSYFVGITESTSYGTFELVSSPNSPFNGYSYMKFEMDISIVSIRESASVNTKTVGSWMSGLDSPLYVTDHEEMNNLTAATVYRVYTVVQAPFVMEDKTAPKGFKAYCIDLLDQIAEIGNFDYEINVVDDKKFGNTNTRRTGLIAIKVIYALLRWIRNIVMRWPFEFT